MLVAAWFVLRSGGRLFILIIAILFGYLALQAIRNMNLFGLASGVVLTWNLGGWARDLASTDGSVSRRGPAPVFARLAARSLVASLIGLMIFTVMTGRFFRATGERRRFGLGESPAAFAHDAARFAGHASLPDRVLAYDLVQAGVYIFHNGPERKVFMDGRLQVPDQETFATYVRIENMLNEGRSSWAAPLRRMGDPLVLLGHSKGFGAEATLLVDRGWRCIFFDAIASVFISNSRLDLEASFPSVDFAARYFRDEKWRTFLQEPKDIAEGEALLNLGGRSKFREGLSGVLPTSIVLSAGHRFRQAIAVDRGNAENWTLLGLCCWDTIADLKAPPPGPAEPWDIARGMFPAQASYCFRRALELDPTSGAASASLVGSLEARGMRDPVRALNGPNDSKDDHAKAPSSAPGARRSRVPGGARHQAAGRGPVRGGAPEHCRCRAPGNRARLGDERSRCDDLAAPGPPCGCAAGLGGAADPPSMASRQSRIAAAALASQDFTRARAGFESALKLDAGLGEAWSGLALLHAQLGEAEEGAAACEAGLRRSLTEAAGRFAQSTPGTVSDRIGSRGPCGAPRMKFDISDPRDAVESAVSSGEVWEIRSRASASTRGSRSFADRIRSAAALNFLSPLLGMTLAALSRVIRRGWGRIEPAFWPRASLLAASGLFNTPLAWYEERSWPRAIEHTVVPPPLFVLGHYRSGTTHLQYLLSHNSSFAYPNLFQSFFPHTFLSTERSLAWLVQLGLVRHRFQDHVRLSLRSPMEDEIALCISTGLSPHMSWALPDQSSFYDRFLTFQDASGEEVGRWKSALLQFVKKLTLKHGRMLVLKSPPHTARIRLLLEVFPEARFVHIHRDPHAVFRSTMHMLESISPYWNLQTPGKHGTEEARIERVLRIYRLMYDAFFEQRQLIRAGNLYELRYEELERDPTGSLRTMYSALKLPGIEQQVLGMQDYLKVSDGYSKNSHAPINDRLRRRRARAWERAFYEWGYPE